MRTARRPPWLSPQAYLALEDAAPDKHEYVNGVMRAMVGASKRHNQVAGALYALLRLALRGSGCTVFMSDVKVRIEAANAYYYPDVLVSCRPDDTDPDIAHHPSVVVEVLSPTTRTIDRSEKLPAYRTIATLNEIILIWPEDARVEVHRREGAAWIIETAGPSDRITIAGVPVDVAALFET